MSGDNGSVPRVSVKRTRYGKQAIGGITLGEQGIGEQELRKDAAELSAPQARHLCVQLAERTAHVRRSVCVLKEDLEGSEEG